MNKINVDLAIIAIIFIAIMFSVVFGNEVKEFLQLSEIVFTLIRFSLALALIVKGAKVLETVINSSSYIDEKEIRKTDDKKHLKRNIGVVSILFITLLLSVIFNSEITKDLSQLAKDVVAVIRIVIMVVFCFRAFPLVSFLLNKNEM